MTDDTPEARFARHKESVRRRVEEAKRNSGKPDNSARMKKLWADPEFRERINVPRDQARHPRVDPVWLSKIKKPK